MVLFFLEFSLFAFLFFNLHIF